MRDTEDDDITLDRNKQLLLKELEKERPRKEIILSLARQTYSIQRVAILSESDTTASILLEQFVELKKYYVVCILHAYLPMSIPFIGILEYSFSASIMF